MFERRETNIQEKLQQSLETYQSRMHEFFLRIVEIKAEFSEEAAWLNPNFDATIMAAQADYNSIFRNALSETAQSIKDVQTMAGTAGLVVKLIEASLHSLTQAAEVQKRVSTTLLTQEEQFPLFKKKALQDKFDQIQKHEKDMDTLVNTFINLNSYLDPDVTRNAKEQACDLYREYQQLNQMIKREIKNLLKKITDYLDTEALQVERDLLRNMMSIHLTRGANSASVVGLNKPLTELGHYFRKKWAREAYVGSPLFRISSLHEPSPFEMRCLTAVLKRHPVADFNPGHPEYPLFIKNLRMVMYLIGTRNQDRTLCERLNLFSSFALNQADKAALSSTLLTQQLPIQQSFFSKSSYAKNKHLAVKATLEGHLTFVRNKLNVEKHIQELQALSKNIIHFYVEHLIQQFLTHPLFSDWVEINSNNEGEQELLTFLVNIINCELEDKTPANYYKSFLCGLSLFCSALGNLGAMKLEVDDHAKLTLNFSGCLTASGELVKHEINFPHTLTTSGVKMALV